MVQIAHMNVARLIAPPGDPRVAEFVDNVTRVNGIAERSSGFIWRMTAPDTRDSASGTYESLFDDPTIASSLSVWQSVEALAFFVYKTVHGGFVRRRENWFAPWGGPNYVIWDVASGHIPDMAEAEARLADLTALGPSPRAFDFHWAQANNRMPAVPH